MRFEDAGGGSPAVRNLSGYAPAARGSGVGSALLEAVKTWARESGTPILECWVSEGNDPAIELYRRHGLTETDETQILRDGSSVTVRRMQAQLIRRP